MDSSSYSLAHDVTGSHDTLRHGLATFKADALPSHPVEIIQNSSRKYQLDTKKHLLEKAYGSAFPLQMEIEQQILSRFQRPPGFLPSSMLGLESLTGALDEMGFEDSFGDPKESESFIPVDMHHAMEIRLGLSKVQKTVARSVHITLERSFRISAHWIVCPATPFDRLIYTTTQLKEVGKSLPSQLLHQKI